MFLKVSFQIERAMIPSSPESQTISLTGRLWNDGLHHRARALVKTDALVDRENGYSDVHEGVPAAVKPQGASWPFPLSIWIQI